MRRMISMLMIARLVQRLLTGGRRGPGTGSWNQGATAARRRGRGTDAGNEPPQGGARPRADGSGPADSGPSARGDKKPPAPTED